MEKLLISPNGLIIPLLTCIGNHEAIDGAFGVTKNEAPLYVRYFSHEIGVYGLNTSLYHSHIFGNYSMVVLDSGVATDWIEQVYYMENVWESQKYKDTRKLLFYHSPLFSFFQKHAYALSHHLARLLPNLDAIAMRQAAPGWIVQKYFLFSRSK
jgi:hypothetical protein